MAMAETFTLSSNLGAYVSERLANHLAKLIASKGEDQESLSNLLRDLEWVVSSKLSAKYPEWKWESLDGIYPARISVVDPQSAEIAGRCILISDQTTTRIFINLKFRDDSSVDIHGKVGEVGCDKGGMRREPYAADPLHRIRQQQELPVVDWVYEF